MRYGAILLPGIVTPAEIAFGPLQEALGDEIRTLLQDLAIYDSDEPPEDYGLDSEIDGVLSAADNAGLERFHLVGYSAGGAVAAAFASRFGDRLVSLTLMEPAWLGNESMTDRERQAFDAAIATAHLPGTEAIAQFVKLNISAGIDPPAPPAGPEPPWMASRPAAIQAIGLAFQNNELDEERLRQLDCPVLYTLGTLSNPDLYSERARRAIELFYDFTLELFEGRHHFDPPHLSEPERLAELLKTFWQRAET